MKTRRSFIASICAAIAFCKMNVAAKDFAFEEKLKVEVEAVMKKHAHEENNESTHRFIEAEIDDWAHVYVISEEIDAFNVICGSIETEFGEECWVKCLFKKHGSKEIKTLTCEMAI